MPIKPALADRPLSHVLMVMGIPNPTDNGDKFSNRAEVGSNFLRDAGIKVEIGLDGETDLDMRRLGRTANGMPDGTLVIISAHGRTNRAHSHEMRLNARALTPTVSLLRTLSRHRDFDYMVMSCGAGQIHRQPVPDTGTLISTSSERWSLDGRDVDAFFAKMKTSSFLRRAVSISALMNHYLMDCCTDVPPAISIPGNGYCNLGDHLDSHRGRPFTSDQKSRIVNAFPDQRARVEQVMPLIETGRLVGRNVLSDWSGCALAVALAADGGMMAMQQKAPLRPDWLPVLERVVTRIHPISRGVGPE